MSEIRSPYDQATMELSLSPQEQYLYQVHLNNLHGTGKVTHPNGDISTLLQTVVSGPNGLYYNIPTVWGGKVLDVPSARRMAEAVGWDKWPGYTTPKMADWRYGKMHDYLEQDTASYIQSMQR